MGNRCYTSSLPYASEIAIGSAAGGLESVVEPPALPIGPRTHLDPLAIIATAAGRTRHRSIPDSTKDRAGSRSSGRRGCG